MSQKAMEMMNAQKNVQNGNMMINSANGRDVFGRGSSRPLR